MDEVNVCLAGMFIGAVGTWMYPPQPGKSDLSAAFVWLFLLSLGYLGMMAWQGRLA